MDRESGATEDPVHDRDTSEQGSDEKRQGSLAISRFGSERPTPNAQRPIPNSELSIGH